MTVLFRLGLALIIAALLWPRPAPAAEPAARRAATPAAETLKTDRSQSLDEWKARAERGDNAAPGALCELLFDGQGGAFDAGETFRWCRRAAELGSAAAESRLGLLSLAGLGTGKDIDAAARYCAAAQARDATVSAGFCLAAVTKEKQRHGGSSNVLDLATRGASTASDSAAAARLAQRREGALRGDRAATAQLCEFYFNAPHGAFESAEAADWCRRATRIGDADSFRRLGLMRLWGVGIEKSAVQAEALCQQAQSLDPAVSAAFCTAAVRQEYAANAAVLTPSNVAKTTAAPPAGRMSPADTLGFDRVLASIHATPTGLQFSCRDIVRWARYETSDGLSIVSSGTSAFGRSILEFGDKDYAALDHAAADCAAAITPYDEDGSTRQQLAHFRRMLPLIKARQREVDREKQVNGTDVPRCVDALHRSRADTQRLVAGGPGGIGQWSDTYECTRTGRWQPAGGSGAPQAAPQRAAGGGR